MLSRSDHPPWMILGSIRLNLALCMTARRIVAPL
jgi:hypothetical protein